LFHDDTVPTFFRRLAFSPDGSVLVCPTGKALAGCAKNVTNATHVFTSWFFAFSGEQIDIFDAILKKKADFATALWRISFDCGSIFSAAVQAS
jgi:hypothetical protein